jgi:hypothetical protein
MTQPTVDIESRVARYVQLRDEIKKRDDEHKEKMRPLRDLLDKYNGALLDHLNSVNGKSISTGAGTVYRSEKKTAPLVDADAFMRYVVDNEEWDLLDRKANVTAVADYITEHNNPPPGVNFTTTFVAGVRRS